MSSTIASRITKSSLVKELSKTTKLRKSRRNIVDPDLCDDVIQRLAPSLAQFIGCTIIDINPGVGLWSSKLHDHLKPRNHILIEPKQNIYLPFLQPLLDVPGSRYRLVDWPDLYKWDPQRFIEEGLLHDTEGLGGPPPTTKEPNNLIFINANLADQKTNVVAIEAKNAACIKAVDYVHAVREGTGFSKYGPTRMLMWLSDNDKMAILPKTVAHRSKLSVLMESQLEVEEIVGFSHASELKIHREDALNHESSRRVAERMQEQGIKIPPHRQSRLEDSGYEVSRFWHKEIQELEEGFQAGKFSKYVECDQEHLALMNKGRSGPQLKGDLTPEYARMRHLRHRATTEHRKIEKINSILKGQEKIDRMTLDLYREDIKPSEKEEIIEALNSSIQEYKSAQETLTGKQLGNLLYLDDDRRAFAMHPPLLMWDRRKCEPLLAREDGFHTRGKMALLDFQPKTTDGITMTPEQNFYFEMIVASLLHTKGHANLKRLHNTAPGAFEALVPQVQAIRDPRQGGRYDIDSLRNRTLTPKMFHELAVACDNWAFKPPIRSALGDSQFSTEESTKRPGTLVM